MALPVLAGNFLRSHEGLTFNPQISCLNTASNTTAGLVDATATDERITQVWSRQRFTIG